MKMKIKMKGTVKQTKPGSQYAFHFPLMTCQVHIIAFNQFPTPDFAGGRPLGKMKKHEQKYTKQNPPHIISRRQKSSPKPHAKTPFSSFAEKRKESQG
jgi:hypothetical protein